ncbi:hypothetical protein KIPB_004375 [Kipferlia bialata]|uniref:Uncharacterized protein n=1 Tax=Kipferlia bialata TaxID=797122 RepID=A0A9K3GI78_9EUKA|nr:hypothetical protein KIPB_004375 [Kipferlia bialata]|eukprot:g4375.t1
MASTTPLSVSLATIKTIAEIPTAHVLAMPHPRVFIRVPSASDTRESRKDKEQKLLNTISRANILKRGLNSEFLALIKTMVGRVTANVSLNKRSGSSSEDRVHRVLVKYGVDRLLSDLLAHASGADEAVNITHALSQTLVVSPGRDREASGGQIDASCAWRRLVCVAMAKATMPTDDETETLTQEERDRKGEEVSHLVQAGIFVRFLGLLNDSIALKASTPTACAIVSAITALFARASVSGRMDSTLVEFTAGVTSVLGLSSTNPSDAFSHVARLLLNQATLPSGRMKRVRPTSIRKHLLARPSVPLSLMKGFLECVLGRQIILSKPLLKDHDTEEEDGHLSLTERTRQRANREREVEVRFYPDPHFACPQGLSAILSLLPHMAIADELAIENGSVKTSEFLVVSGEILTLGEANVYQPEFRIVGPTTEKVAGAAPGQAPVRQATHVVFPQRSQINQRAKGAKRPLPIDLLCQLPNVMHVLAEVGDCILVNRVALDPLAAESSASASDTGTATVAPPSQLLQSGLAARLAISMAARVYIHSLLTSNVSVPKNFAPKVLRKAKRFPGEPDICFAFRSTLGDRFPGFQARVFASILSFTKSVHFCNSAGSNASIAASVRSSAGSPDASTSLFPVSLLVHNNGYLLGSAPALAPLLPPLVLLRLAADALTTVSQSLSLSQSLAARQKKRDRAKVVKDTPTPRAIVELRTATICRQLVLQEPSLETLGAQADLLAGLVYNILVEAHEQADFAKQLGIQLMLRCVASECLSAGVSDSPLAQATRDRAALLFSCLRMRLCSGPDRLSQLEALVPPEVVARLSPNALPSPSSSVTGHEDKDFGVRLVSYLCAEPEMCKEILTNCELYVAPVRVRYQKRVAPIYKVVAANVERSGLPESTLFGPQPSETQLLASEDNKALEIQPLTREERNKLAHAAFDMLS